MYEIKEKLRLDTMRMLGLYGVREVDPPLGFRMDCAIEPGDFGYKPEDFATITFTSALENGIYRVSVRSGNSDVCRRAYMRVLACTKAEDPSEPVLEFLGEAA